MNQTKGFKKLSTRWKAAKVALKDAHRLRRQEKKENQAAEKARMADAKKRKREEEKEAKSAKKRKTGYCLNFDSNLGINTRLKPAKVLETSEKVVEELVKNYHIGLTEMPLETLATRVGYKNPRSDPVADAIKLLKHRGMVEKTKEKVKFTQKGIDAHIEEEEMQVPENPEAVLEMYWEQFETRLKASKKGSGTKALTSSKKVWDLLKDGQAHDVKEVLKVADYSGENSAGMEEIKRQLRLLQFAEKVNKKFTFTEKVLKPLRGEM